MNKKFHKSVMPILLGVAGVYVLLAQFATVNATLHDWIHGDFEGATSCEHSKCNPSQGSDSDTEGTRPHDCFVTLLASGLLDSPIIAITIDVPVILLDFCLIDPGVTIAGIVLGHDARAPPVFPSH